jgi:hypothetical protein
MKPENDRCEEHGLYLYRTGFGWSCKLGCYYTDDTQKIKDGFIAQYKEELKDKINEIDIWNKNGLKVKKEILELLKNEG